jgi:hypothetical protein
LSIRGLETTGLVGGRATGVGAGGGVEVVAGEWVAEVDGPAGESVEEVEVPAGSSAGGSVEGLAGAVGAGSAAGVEVLGVVLVPPPGLGGIVWDGMPFDVLVVGVTVTGVDAFDDEVFGWVVDFGGGLRVLAAAREFRVICAAWELEMTRAAIRVRPNSENVIRGLRRYLFTGDPCVSFHRYTTVECYRRWS